jgi:hypothetical protein
MKKVLISSYSSYLTRSRNLTNSVYFACSKPEQPQPSSYRRHDANDDLGLLILARQNALYRGKESTG